MSAGALSGTLGRPAAGPFFPGAVIGAANSRRLAAAALAVVVVHVAVLAVRPGAIAGNGVAPAAAPVMAVRMLRPRPADAATGPSPAVVAVPAAAPQAPALERPPQPEPERPARAVAQAAPAPVAAPGPSTAAQAEVRPAPAVATTEAKGGDAPLAAAPDYAFGVRLDPGPRPLADIEPEYPDLAHLREGVVVLRLLISDTGHVDNVAVVRAEPRGIFEQAALDAFSKARFSPGLAAGTPVKSQITVEVQFMPVNRGARVSGRTY